MIGIRALRFPLSPPLRLGLRTALALVLAYGVALANDWQRPNWAGFAVVVLSLNTGGESIRKAVMRLGGTLAGAVAALSLIALFPQDRWNFLFGLAVWVGFCCYRMTGSPTPYAWQVAGFVCPIIAIDGGPPNGMNDFLTAVERLQETFTGVLAYSLSCLLIRTGSSRAVFQSEMDGLIGQLRTLSNLLPPTHASSEHMAPSIQKVAGAIRHRVSRFQALLPPAMSESAAFREDGPRWRAAVGRLPALLDAFERLVLLIDDLPSHQRPWLQRHLHRLRCGMERSLLGLEQLLGKASALRPGPGIPEADPATARRELASLPLPGRLTAALCLQQIETLVQLTDSIEADTLGTGPGPGEGGYSANHHRAAIPLPDPDRLASSLWSGMTIVVAGLVWIYVPDAPGGSSLIAITGSLALALVSLPGANARMLLKPFLGAFAVTAPIYVLIMPRMANYTSLAILLALVAFLYSALTKPVTRLMGLIFFLTATSITNLQRYSVIALIDIGLLFCIVLGILTLLQEIPFSSRPEQQFLRLLRHFSRSLEVAALPRPLGSRLQRVAMVLHRRRLTALPSRLARLRARVPLEVLGCSEPRMETLLTQIETLMLWLRLWWELDPPRSVSFDAICPGPRLLDPLAPLNSLAALVSQEESRALQGLASSTDVEAIPAEERERLELWAACSARVGENLQNLGELGGTMDWQAWHQPRFA